MESKSEAKQKRVNISVPLTGYPRTMRFNRFSLEDMGSYAVAHFGFISKQGLLCDLYSFAMAKEDIKVNRDTTLGYLDRMGSVPDYVPEHWTGSSERRTVDAIRVMAMSHSGDNAEIALCTFCMGVLLSKNRPDADKTEYVAQPVALLSCESALQKYVLTQLFIESHD